MSLAFNKNYVPLFGNSFPVKDRLKAEGCRWEPKDKTWYAPIQKAELLKKFVRWGTTDLKAIEELEAEERNMKTEVEEIERKDLEARSAARKELKELVEMTDAQIDVLFGIMADYWEHNENGRLRYSSPEKKKQVEDILIKHGLIESDKSVEELTEMISAEIDYPPVLALRVDLDEVEKEISASADTLALSKIVDGLLDEVRIACEGELSPAALDLANLVQRQDLSWKELAERLPGCYSPIAGLLKMAEARWVKLWISRKKGRL